MVRWLGIELVTSHFLHNGLKVEQRAIEGHNLHIRLVQIVGLTTTTVNCTHCQGHNLPCLTGRTHCEGNNLHRLIGLLVGVTMNSNVFSPSEWVVTLRWRP